jgi:23S rRNA pseudouridine1911/1915/1917 synthase
MPERTEVFVIDRSFPSERFDTYLRKKFPAASRGTLKRLIEEGHVTINGAKIKPTHAPRAGENVEVRWPEAKPADAQPQEMDLRILYEDEVLLVLNKEAGVVVHPAAGHEDQTLVNALLYHCKGQLSGIGGVARPGIVHRLDKETSGCLVVAKNDDAHLALSSQFASRKVEKTYHAIVCGEVTKEQGQIRAAIGRHSSHRKKMAVTDESGREALTSYKVIERLVGSTLMEVAIHTGRTHQIRVHFQFIGHPVAGDATYGNRQNLRLEELTGFAAGRQMLHASRLTFIHPRSGKRMTFEAPWPEDFLDAVERLRGLPA